MTRHGQLRIIVLGWIVRGQLGGMAWHYLNYVLGLIELGHDVYYIEDSDGSPNDPSGGLSFAAHIFDRLGLQDRWAYYDAHRATWRGACAKNARALCESADLILNVSGVNPLRSWLERVPRRVLIDTDPGFTQLRHIGNRQLRARAETHNIYFTFGANIGQADCRIPDDGFPWQVTRQPVSLDTCSFARGCPDGHFTTVMTWDPWEPHRYGELTLRTKSASFPQFSSLPSRVGKIFEIAVSYTQNAPELQETLMRDGWLLANIEFINSDPWAYLAFIRGSRGEFGLAKEGYVVTRSGWFSERSAVYLASGRPVLAHDTAFTNWLPTGEGVVSFSSLEDVVEAVLDIEARYETYCRAARDIAAEYFGSRQVLSRLIESATASPSTT